MKIYNSSNFPHMGYTLAQFPTMIGEHLQALLQNNMLVQKPRTTDLSPQAKLLPAIRMVAGDGMHTHEMSMPNFKLCKGFNNYTIDCNNAI